MQAKLIVIPIAAIVVVAAIFLWGGVSFAPTYTVKVGYMATTHYPLVFIAHDEGFFKQVGLKVKMKSFNDPTALLNALAKGDIDIAPVSVTALFMYIAQGADIYIVGGASEHAAAIICLPDRVNEFKSLKDLEGKKVATMPLLPGDVIIKSLLKKEGVNVTFVEYLNHMDIIEAVENGEVDAGVSWDPYATLAIARGLAVAFWDHELLYPKSHPCCIHAASKKFVEEHPDLVIKYFKAMVMAEEFMKENPSKSYIIVCNYVKTVPKDIIWQSIFEKDPRLNKPHTYISCKISAEETAALVDMMVDAGYLTEQQASLVKSKIVFTYRDQALKESS